MPEYSIEKTNFEKQKKELKEFANQPATSTELDKFSTGGQWSDFWSGGFPGVLSGHKVTGEEMNRLVTELQSCFAEINERDRKVIKEFGQVYETFEALDKGYIQGILIGVESAKHASEEAKAAQKDADDAIKALQITISKLKQFKDEVNRHKHLKDIDEMWSDVHRIDGQIEEISEKVDTYEPQIEALSKKIDDTISGIQEHINALTEYNDNLEKIEHLSDIDSLWTDVDDEWEYSHSLGKEVETLSGKTSEIENNVAGLKDIIATLDKENIELKNKIKIAIVVAGGALGFFVLQLILSAMGIL